jgi:hypothetical protein
VHASTFLLFSSTLFSSFVCDEVDFGIWDFTMTEGGKSEVQGEAWVRSLLTLKQPPAALQFMDGKRAQRWASTYKGASSSADLGHLLHH